MSENHKASSDKEEVVYDSNEYFIDGLLPSTCDHINWLCVDYTDERTGAAKVPQDINCVSKCGKWLIFTETKDVDDVWFKIKTAVKSGILGFSAKVSTIKPKPANIGYEPGKHVICVYTYDYSDYEDVMRVRNQLTILGFTQRLGYKADVDTLAGKYRARGHKNVCIYRC